MHTKKEVIIIPFAPDLQNYIKELNTEWLEKYFKIEEKDEIIFADPQSEIIDKGGMIFYAQYDNKIVGTISLLKIDQTNFELSKMAVTNTAQGLGIGHKLMEHSLKIAKENAIKKLVLYSNKKLLPALYLYEKYGFQEVSMGENLYERADIKMELTL